MTDTFTGTDEQVARGLAGRFVRRRSLRSWIALLAGIALVVAGLAGFGVYGGRQDALARHGVHTTATVTATALYGGRLSRNSFTEHIDVEFAYPGGFARNVRIWVGENTNYWVGKRVEVIYDPANPHHAELAGGRSDIGPVGFPLVLAIIAGAVAAVVGAANLRLCRGARRALRGPSRPMVATTSLRRRGRTTACWIELTAPGQHEEVESAKRRGWYPLLQPADVTVFGDSDSRVLVVVDPVRRAVTAGRLRRARRWTGAGLSLHGRALAVAVVLGGAVATVALVAWTFRAEHAWRESGRVQAGPRVLSVIVSTGRIARGRQAATLRYRDLSGGRHLTTVRYPLGLAGSAIPGMSTTVAYDPASPDTGELAAHPTHRWQTFAVAAVLAVAVTAAWLACAALLLAGPSGRRRPGFALLVGTAVAVAIGVALLASTARDLRFPPPPPPASTADAVAARLPPVLSTPAASVTPAGARAIAAAAWPVRDRALVDHDLATLRAVETGPALAVDVARMNAGEAPNRAVPALPAPPTLTAYVPRQSRWPLRFLAEAATTTAGTQPWVELLIFARTAPREPWLVVFDTGFGVVAGRKAAVEPGSFDRDGYDVVPHPAWLDASDAVPHLARYWQAWLERGGTVASVPSFLPGTWTTEFGQKVAGQQDEPDFNGLPAHTSYGDRTVPASEVWTFGVYGNEELVCSPMHQTTVWTGPAHQDANRQKWGSDLAPGRYSSVTVEVLREPCILVPSAPGGLVAFGADRMVVATRGRPER